MPQYLLRMVLDHLSFRLPSLLSVSQVFGFPIRFVSEDKSRGLLVIELEKEEHLQHILDRDTLVQSASELYAEGASYDDLHKQLKGRLEVFEPYMDSTFKFKIDSTHHKIPDTRQVSIIEGFAYTALRGGINLKTPDVEFFVCEDYDWIAANDDGQQEARDGQFRWVYFGRYIAQGRARQLIVSHSVKTRAYYGNTSMEAQMGFLMANQALPAPGKLIYDPFVGTGSMLYSVAQFGAMVFGSDIDGRQIRGKAKGKGLSPGIIRSAEQYGIRDQFLDFFTFDVTKSPLRQGGWVDAIITDPPYGVRAGAKRLGRKGGKKPLRDEPYQMPDGSFSHKRPDYLPPCRPYELANLTLDLIQLARWLLVPKGRLVFFLPTVTEDYDEIDIPKVEGMRELKIGEGSVQDFGKWGRRLITMEKTATDDGERPTFEDHEEFGEDAEHLPGHYGFNKRYLAGFRDSESGSTSPIPRSGAESKAPTPVPATPSE
ncbi:tRNA (guanine10-N2)-methyltransferase [Cryptococcus wingfieldii CBS 7118]|uniref:tRNA (guanine(10)-N(2))-methyltransferase n=1 Tax=Cryptococcus wingfieldii CBS 7118 TaxID=1295528 RepID=A0A1E3IHJ1_9TREE|nr:tRNA (guanine10-N2)-methyltransferase [Cryptococcus wingfieldii CBS 7118]ODN88067.1 tRNA (guanine10-N2)-methyltransferase [Cryptococcus wingfieldii CBS 7118]